MWALLIGLLGGAAACDATEPPFRNAYWDNYSAGLYVDTVNGEPLFSSHDKFDSGTGWPSFTQPIEPERVVTSSDWSFGALRTEVRSSGSDVHLGHVFGDGPAPTGLRYCINSYALRFIPAEDLVGHGYREYHTLFASPPVANTAPDGASTERTGFIEIELSDELDGADAAADGASGGLEISASAEQR